jgi:hypothetical protein
MIRSLSVCLLVGLTVACSNDKESPPPPGTTTLITPDGSEELDCVRDPDQIGCVDQHSDRGDCGPSSDFDIIQDVDGNIVDIICYPAATEGNSDVILVDDGTAVEAGNNDVIVLDGVIDGADIEGNLDIESNNVTVVGDGPDVSIISGDLNVDKNNLAVRGVRIQGNVELGTLDDGSTGNNPAFVFCVVEGDVIIEGNNVTFAGCDIFGNVEVIGNNTVLIQNRIQGELVIVGDNTECDGNLTFTDTDGDFVVLEEEVGEPLSCGVPSSG